MQVWKFLGMHPFGRGFPKVVLAAGAAYGALGLVLRVALGTSLPVFALYQVVAGLLYLAMLWRHRESLQLTVLREELRRRNRRRAGDPGHPGRHGVGRHCRVSRRGWSRAGWQDSTVVPER